MILTKFKRFKDKFITLFLKSKTYLLTKDRQTNSAFISKKNELYDRWWMSAADDIAATISSEGFGYKKITKGDRYTFIKSECVMLDTGLQLDMAGDKPFTYEILRKLELPVPVFIEYNLSSIQTAYDLLENSNRSFVAKPCFGTGGGKGVTTGITSCEKLRQASYIASIYCSRIMLEEFISGASYRLLYLNGKFIDAIRREPPHIKGDGKSTIKELINKVNHSRLTSSQPEAINPLIIDLDLRQTLSNNNLTLSSVIAKDELVQIKTVINQNSRNENHRVTHEVHNSIIQQGKSIVDYLGLELAGVDVITDDISIPLSKSNGYINEINTTPGLHLHTLIAEPENSYPVFRQVLEYLIKKGIKL